MAKPARPELSRREREILEILYRLESASAADVQKAMADPPSYSAVRAHLRILEEKGHVRHRSQGQRYIFSPTLSREKARRNALRGLLKNFFSGSKEEVVATLLDMGTEGVSDAELERIAELIDQAREEGR